MGGNKCFARKLMFDLSWKHRFQVAFASLFRAQPHGADHAAGLAVAAVGEKAVALEHGTVPAAVDLANTDTAQGLGGKQVDIGQVFAAADGLEGGFGGGVGLGEGRLNVAAHFKSVGADGGAEPGEEVGRVGLHGGDGVFQHAAGETAPAGVGGSHDAAGAVAEEYGQAVGGHDGTGGAAAVVESGVGFRRGTKAVGSGHYAVAVHLAQIGQRQGGVCLHAAAVFGHGGGIVAHVVAYVQAGETALADAALAGGTQGVDIVWRGPIGVLEAT